MEVEESKPVVCPEANFQPQQSGPGSAAEEYAFWQRMVSMVLGTDVNLGLDSKHMTSGLRTLRNTCLLSVLVLNGLWLLLLSILYFNANLNLHKLNIYGLIAAAVYGLVLFIQLLGMGIHRIQAVFARFARAISHPDIPVWVYKRMGN